MINKKKHLPWEELEVTFSDENNYNEAYGYHLSNHQDKLRLVYFDEPALQLTSKPADLEIDFKNLKAHLKFNN